MTRPYGQVPTCHPGRRHVGLGMCSSCYSREYGRRPSKRAAQLKHKFGITLAQYDKMLSRQGGVCAICCKPPRKRRLAVDHDHKTKRVRGLLCWWCNNRIVTSRTTSEHLRKAADYLDSDFDGRSLT